MPEINVDLWLRPEEVEPEAILTFTDVGEEGVIKKPEGEEDVPTFEIGVKLPDGSKRKWTMNKTSQRAVATAYGTNTDKWVDTQVAVFVSEQNIQGTMKKVIYARVPAKAL